MIISYMGCLFTDINTLVAWAPWLQGAKFHLVEQIKAKKEDK